MAAILQATYCNQFSCISMTFVPKRPINNNTALIQIMAWHCSGNKPLSESVMAQCNVTAYVHQWLYYIYVAVRIWIWMHPVLMFIASRFLADIDDCEFRNCTNDQGLCIDKLNAYFCHCKSGYNGTDCEISKWGCHSFNTTLSISCRHFPQRAREQYFLSMSFVSWKSDQKFNYSLSWYFQYHFISTHNFNRSPQIRSHPTIKFCNE